MRSNPQYTHRARRTTIGFAVAAIVATVGIVGSTAAGAIRLPSDSTSGGAEVDSMSTDARPADYRLEKLRLGCEVRQTDEQSGVVCRWSAPTSDRAAAVRLVRVQAGASHGRQVVYRSANLEITEFVDAPVRPGHRYVYVVQALSHSGRVVGSSRPVTVAVPLVEPPKIEPLRLNCAAAAIDKPTDRIHVGCEWSLPQEARELTLWRSVDGAAREIAATFTYPFESSYRDVLPAGTHKVVYAVIATNSSGRIVAQSRPELVLLRPTDVAPTDVPKTDVAPTDVVPPTDVPGDVVSTPPTDIAPTDVSETVPVDSRPTGVVVTDVPTSDVADTDRTRSTDREPPREEAPERDVAERDTAPRGDTSSDRTRSEGAD